MRKVMRCLQISGFVVAVQGALGCAVFTASEKTQWSPAQISDFKSIAGKWEGIMIRTPTAKDDDWVNVSIQDNGDYEFVSYRTIGVFSGKGKLTVKDGKAVAQNEKGNLTMQLFTDTTKGQSMLKAESKGKDGISYRAELTKAGQPTKKIKQSGEPGARAHPNPAVGTAASHIKWSGSQVISF